jgi:hypothetical protein
MSWVVYKAVHSVERQCVLSDRVRIQSAQPYWAPIEVGGEKFWAMVVCVSVLIELAQPSKDGGLRLEGTVCSVSDISQFEDFDKAKSAVALGIGSKPILAPPEMWKGKRPSPDLIRRIGDFPTLEVPEGK